MTFDQLEILENIVERGSFKAAAEALHRTQPTLSIAIKKLEEEFDLLLFNRETYRPSLTPEGEVFFKWAKQTLRSYRELNHIARELGTQKVEPKLTIVIDPLTRFNTLEAIFTECLADKSLPTELTIRSEVLEGGLGLLLGKQADFAIAPEFEAHADIESLPFDQIELVPCMRKSLLPSASSAKNKKGSLLASPIEGLTQIIVRTPAQLDGEKSESSMGVLSGGRKCYVTDHAMKRALIREGFGWGRLARHEIESDLREKLLTVIEHADVPSIHLPLRLMRNRKQSMGPVARAVWSRLKERIR